MRKRVKSSKETIHHEVLKDRKLDRPNPMGGGSGGCGESAYEKRAKLLYNCMFGEGPVQKIPGLTPLIYPNPDEVNTLPSCNQVTRSFFGSSTGPGVVDPPEWAVSGGPTKIKYL